MLLKNGIVKPAVVVEINDIGKPLSIPGKEEKVGVIVVRIGRMETKAKKLYGVVNTKGVKENIYGVFLDGVPPSYKDVFNHAIKPLINAVGEESSVNFLLKLMDTGEMDARVLEKIKNYQGGNENINTLRGYLSAWVTMIHISEEQRTTGTGQSMLRVLEDFREYKKTGVAHLLDFEPKSTAAAGAQDAAVEPKISSLKAILNPKNKVFAFMGKGGSPIWKGAFTTPEGQVTRQALENQERVPSDGFFSPGSAQKRIRLSGDGLINPRIRFDSPVRPENVAAPL